MTNTLYVANEAQKVLFDSELSGQISDGHWENASPHDHWKPWADAEVVVAPDHQLGRTFYARKSNYNFLAADLLEVVADRMIEAVKEATGNRAYDFDDLKADLRALKAIVRTEATARPEDVAAFAAKQRSEAAARATAQAKRTAQAARINEVAKKLGISMYASEYQSGVTVPHALLVELLELKLAVDTGAEDLGVVA